MLAPRQHHCRRSRDIIGNILKCYLGNTGYIRTECLVITDMLLAAQNRWSLHMFHPKRFLLYSTPDLPICLVINCSSLVPRLSWNANIYRACTTSVFAFPSVGAWERGYNCSLLVTHGIHLRDYTYSVQNGRGKSWNILLHENIKVCVTVSIATYDDSRLLSVWSWLLSEDEWWAQPHVVYSL